MLNFGASKPRVKGGPGPLGPPLDPHLSTSSPALVNMFEFTPASVTATIAVQ